LLGLTPEQEQQRMREQLLIDRLIASRLGTLSSSHPKQ